MYVANLASRRQTAWVNRPPLTSPLLQHHLEAHRPPPRLRVVIAHPRSSCWRRLLVPSEMKSMVLFWSEGRGARKMYNGTAVAAALVTDHLFVARPAPLVPTVLPDAQGGEAGSRFPGDHEPAWSTSRCGDGQTRGELPRCSFETLRRPRNTGCPDVQVWPTVCFECEYTIRSGTPFRQGACHAGPREGIK